MINIDGKKVFDERVKLGLSLRDMQQLTKVSKSTLSRIESVGKISVHITTAGKIAKSLKKDIEYFRII